MFRNRSTPFSTDNFLKKCALALPMRATSIGMSYSYKKEFILGEASTLNANKLPNRRNNTEMWKQKKNENKKQDTGN